MKIRTFFHFPVMQHYRTTKHQCDPTLPSEAVLASQAEDMSTSANYRGHDCSSKELR